MPERNGLRLIFVNRYFHPDHSATSQLLTDLATDLSRRGWAVSVLTSRQSYEDADARLGAVDDVDGVSVRRLWSTRFGRGNLTGRALDYLTFYLSIFFALLRRASRDTIVIAETDPPLVSVPALLAVRLRGAILVNWIHDLFPEIAEELGVLRKRGLIANTLRRLRDASLRRARTNVVLGERMEEIVRARGGATELRPNWADGTAIHPVPREENEKRRELRFGGAFIVGYSGNLGRAHDFETLFEVMRLLSGDEHIRFVFTGAGASYERLRTMTEGAGLRNVVFRAYQPRSALAESLSMPDVHLVTLRSSVEGLIVPSKFYGIAAAGRPTIMVGDERGEIASIVRRHDCGIAVGDGRSDDLADAIRGLATDRARVERMGANARTLFESHFDAPLALAAWDEILRRVASNR